MLCDGKVIRSITEPRKGIRCQIANVPATTSIQVTGDQEPGADYLATEGSRRIRPIEGLTTLSLPVDGELKRLLDELPHAPPVLDRGNVCRGL
jgi:hypothetical protein